MTTTDRTLPASFYISYKKRVHSENWVRYPLKRIDWNPNGNRNTQNRGKSPSIADELMRILEKYGMSAILSEAEMHGCIVLV